MSLKGSEISCGLQQHGMNLALTENTKHGYWSFEAKRKCAIRKWILLEKILVGLHGLIIVGRKVEGLTRGFQ